MTNRTLLLTTILGVGSFGWVTTGCKPKSASQAQICKKGCEYRLACIEELELDKAVTEANRRITRQNQQKKHDGFLKFCVDTCSRDPGQSQSNSQSPNKRRLTKRMRGYATCGVKAKTCTAFFKCAGEVERAGSQRKANGRRK